MKSKVRNILRLFQIFGLYFETEIHLKIDKIFAKISKIIWIFMITLMVASISIFYYFTIHLWRWDTILLFIFFTIIRLSEFLILLLSRIKSKNDQKFLKNLTEVDELMKNFLDIKINHVQFSRKEFLKIFVQLSIFGIGMMTNNHQKTKSNLFKDHVRFMQWTILIMRMFMLKYNFYLNAMHFQMKVRKIQKISVKNIFLKYQAKSIINLNFPAQS